MSTELKHYLYRTDRSHWESDKQLFQELEKCGVQLDVEFGVVPLDEKGQSIALRGWSTDQTNLELHENHAIEAFADLPIGPMSKK